MSSQHSRQHHFRPFLFPNSSWGVCWSFALRSRPPLRGKGRLVSSGWRLFFLPLGCWLDSGLVWVGSGAPLVCDRNIASSKRSSTSVSSHSADDLVVWGVGCISSKSSSGSRHASLPINFWDRFTIFCTKHRANNMITFKLIEDAKLCTQMYQMLTCRQARRLDSASLLPGVISRAFWPSLIPRRSSLVYGP